MAIIKKVEKSVLNIYAIPISVEKFKKNMFLDSVALNDSIQRNTFGKFDILINLAKNT